MRRIAILCVSAAALAAASPASAQVQPAGTGEPAYTNSAQNTQWFEWSGPTSVDSYRIRYDYTANGVLKSSPTVSYPRTGSSWADWSGVTSLQHGGQYGICAQGQYTFGGDPMVIPDGPNSCSTGTQLGRRAYTTIDRSKPTAAVSLAGGAGFVRDTKVPIRIDFADDVAGPFPGNFLCFQVGGGPAGVCNSGAGYIYGYNPSCSVPATGGKSTTFTCTADYGQVADGVVWACVIAADASIPDNPSGPNQTASAEKANLSAPSCDDVVIDRTPPTVSIAAGSAAIKAGDLVSFSSTASDATSGLAGAGQWTWGDGAGTASGDAVTHTYTQPGTYEVALTVTDAAGNTATARKTITVTAMGGQTNPPPPGGGGTTPPPVTEPTEPPSLDLGAPRSARARAKSIPVELTASDTGRVQLALKRGARVIARASVRLDADGTADYRLKLPKGTKAGRYTLKATYTPPGGRPLTASRALRLTGKPAARRASASSFSAPVLDGGPRALPDGRFHGTRPARTFAVR
jgi:PKD repeat protein